MGAAFLILVLSGLIGGVGYLALKNRQRLLASLTILTAVALVVVALSVAFWEEAAIESGGSRASASPTPTANVMVED